MVEEKKVSTGSTEAVLVEVPTQTTIAYKLEEDKIVDEKGLLVKIYNDIQIIKRSIA